MRNFDDMYMEIAETISKQSRARRVQVGALLVRDGNILSFGYNGTPSGFENECENPIFDTDGTFLDYETKWYVLHAESNALAKVAKSTQSSEGSTLYVTMSPCRECSKLILQAGIKRVVYSESYRDSAGLDLLKKAGVDVVQISSGQE